MIKFIKRLSVFLVLTLMITMFTANFSLPKANAAFGDRITVSGTQFMAGGQRISINGANTPWDNWDDFGGNYDANWWTSHFQQLHDNGVNAVRVWITCSGDTGINISTDGTVSGATSQHWSDLDSFFSIAQSKGIYIMATLISFDAFKNTYTNYQKWRNMIANDTKIDSYVNNYVKPFVDRYKNNPYLWSIDLMNEPDWVYEDAACGNISWDRMQTYFAKAAVAIHANSSILVNVGIAMSKYNSDTCSGAVGNKVSNAALQAKVNDSRAKVDFYSPHYYDWMGAYWGVPFYESTLAFGLETSKPAIVGECPANGTTGHTLTQDYESGYNYGWQGAMAWSSNGVDSQGGFDQLTPATRAFRDNHYSLVFPGGGGTSPYALCEDSLNSDWENWSWNGTINFSTTSPVYSGSYSVSNNFTSAWAGFALHKKSGSIQTSAYNKITFYMHGGTVANQALSLYLHNGEQACAEVNINSYIEGGSLAAGTWRKVTVPLSALGAANISLTRFTIQDTLGAAQPIFYIDKIMLEP
ncbi:MAG TPA: hypothetical protein VIK78_16880 [Ruminiclostridium sp.]